MKSLILFCFLATITSMVYAQKYMVNSEFYKLHQGVTEQEFLDWMAPRAKVAANAQPANVKMFNYGGATWKVYVYDIYRMVGNAWSGRNGYFDHQEYVAFKNGLLVEYGTGDLPLTLRQNPNSYQYDIHNH